MAKRTGLPAAVAQAGAGAAIAEELSEADQIALDLGLDLERVRKRPVGRPAGQRNVRVQRVADYLLGRYRDPLEGLVQMAAMPLEQLAEALGCSRFEAAQEQRLCRIAALPYLHQRQAIAVDMTHRTQVDLTIVDGFAPADGGDIDGAEIVEFQGVDDHGP